MTQEQETQIAHVNALTTDVVRVELLPGHGFKTPTSHNHTHIMVHKDKARQLIASGEAQLDEVTWKLEVRIAALEAAK